MPKEIHAILKETLVVSFLAGLRTYQHFCISQKYFRRFSVIFWKVDQDLSVLVGPCHHGMARPQVADRGTASDKEGSCE